VKSVEGFKKRAFKLKMLQHTKGHTHKHTHAHITCTYTHTYAHPYFAHTHTTTHRHTILQTHIYFPDLSLPDTPHTHTHTHTHTHITHAHAHTQTELIPTSLTKLREKLNIRKARQIFKSILVHIYKANVFCVLYCSLTHTPYILSSSRSLSLCHTRTHTHTN